MNSPLLILRRHLGRIAFFGLLLAAGGCWITQSSEREKLMMPHVNGSWRGRVELTKVYTQHEPGVAYDALELHVERGPSLTDKYGPMDSFVGVGNAPLLARVVRGTPMLLKPTELKVGKVIEVHGTMMVAFVELPETPDTQRPIVSRMLANGKTTDEHVLLIDAEPWNW